MFATSETGLTDKFPSSPSVTDRKDAAKTSGFVVLKPTTDVPFVHTCKVAFGVEEFEAGVEDPAAAVLLAAVPPLVPGAGEPLSDDAAVAEVVPEFVAVPELLSELAVEAEGQVVGFCGKAATMSVWPLLVIEMFVVLRATSTT